MVKGSSAVRSGYHGTIPKSRERNVKYKVRMGARCGCVCSIVVSNSHCHHPHRGPSSRLVDLAARRRSSPRLDLHPRDRRPHRAPLPSSSVATSSLAAHDRRPHRRHRPHQWRSSCPCGAAGQRGWFALTWCVERDGAAGGWAVHPFNELFEKVEHLGRLDCVFPGCE